MRKAKTRERKEGMVVEQRETRRKGRKKRKIEQVRQRENGKKVRITREKTEENQR